MTTYHFVQAAELGKQAPDRPASKSQRQVEREAYRAGFIACLHAMYDLKAGGVSRIADRMSALEDHTEVLKRWVFEPSGKGAYTAPVVEVAQ